MSATTARRHPLTEATAPTADIVVEDLRKVYPNGVVGLERISLAIERGSFFSLLGPSGCGKSTLLRILAGLERPTAGIVRIRGTDVTAVAPDRRPTNLVFQRLALFPHLSVAKNVAFGPTVQGRSRSEVRSRVAEMLELVGLTGMADRLPGQLSGGQQQRVAIARALANRPTVLLLDEPLSALDLKLRTQMQLSLKRIQRDSGTTFVYVTHDQGEAMTMSDALAVMNDGRIEQVGTPADLYRRPQTLFTATFLGETNVFRGERDGARLRVGNLAIAVAGEGEVACVRPESVRLVDPAAGGERRYDTTATGRVADVIFSGSVLRYRIDTSDGAEIVAEQPASGAYQPAPGDEVRIGWDEADAITVSEHSPSDPHPSDPSPLDSV